MSRKLKKLADLTPRHKIRRLDNILENRQHVQENQVDSMSNENQTLEENGFVGEMV